MPTAPRPARSLLALALVVNLLAASAPATAFGVQRVADDRSSAGRAALPEPADRQTSGGVARVSDALQSTNRPRILPVRADWTGRPRTTVPEPKPTAVSKGGSAPASATHGALKGRNHVWIPALGIDRSVAGYACSSSYYPGDRVYRWGCAGSNNVYLFGHAHSVFKPLHDAYVRGRLKKGMKVYYANGDGRVATYAVSWWRLTTPDKGAWAFAGQSRPSLTLQTCVGSKSQYRLIVRLAKV
jgi:hypothetical protein